MNVNLNVNQKNYISKKYSASDYFHGSTNCFLLIWRYKYVG